MFVVTDLGSTNGTYVNDGSVQERTLRDGDQVKIGHTIFKFICGGNIELSYHEEIYRLMTFDGLTQIHNKRVLRDGARARGLAGPPLPAARSRSCSSTSTTSSRSTTRAATSRATPSSASSRRWWAPTSAGRTSSPASGGEEFALVLPEIAIDAARCVGEKLRAPRRAHPLPLRGAEIPITVQLRRGRDRRHARPTGATELYKLADEQLYEAKRGGRNRVAW